MKSQFIYISSINQVDEIIKYILLGNNCNIKFEKTYYKLYFFNKLHIFTQNIKIINCSCTYNKLKEQLNCISNEDILIYDCCDDVYNDIDIDEKNNQIIYIWM